MCIPRKNENRVRFSNADHVYSYMRKIGNPYWREDSTGSQAFVYKVSGIENGYNKAFGENYQYVEIDASICDFIINLNKNGLKTRFCCSGIEREHKPSESGRSSMSSGYIVFEDNPKLIPKLKKIFKELRIEKVGPGIGVYIPYHRGQQREIIKCWQNAKSNLKHAVNP